MIAPLTELKGHWELWHVVVTFIGSYGFTRVYNTIVKAMPPLPANASWWATWFYAIMQGLADTVPQGSLKS